MTLASTTNSVRSPPKKRPRKPPACDSCKARRVLCHPQPEGIACPRCKEKGVICKTTPVQRGRPRKVLEPEELISSASQEPQPSASGSDGTPVESIVTLRPRIELSDAPEIPAELVKHLVECGFEAFVRNTSTQPQGPLAFVHFPECRFPLFNGDRLRAAVASVSWEINLLPPQVRVLVCCACALSASISFDPTVIGPGPAPKSFKDRSVFFFGSDLRQYGVRRAPICRALYERAFTLACETRIHIDVSEDNATSCFFLNILERLNETTSRPWAVAYVSHSRILVGSRPDIVQHRPIWSGFLMAEALAATLRRMPILYSHTDQLLMGGSEPTSLEQLSQTLQTMHQASKKVSSVVFTAIIPYMFHVTTLARDLYDNISGDYARRHPIAEASVIKLLSSLSILQSIVTPILDQLQLSFSGDLQLLCTSSGHPLVRSKEENLRSCVFAMSVSFTSLVLGLYREIEHRASSEVSKTQTQWLRERTAVLQRQVQEMAGVAVSDVARTLQLLPALPHVSHLEWGSIQEWSQFCLTEAATTGSIPPARVQVFESLIAALKLFGYSWDVPRSSELIEQMEACVAQHKASHLFPNLALVPVFPFENNWTGMFGLDQCDLETYDNSSIIVPELL
ncbi:hypothetical protein C8R47DRAFT_689207 [Mycena vitilis]|nr:hypothetical protein C8R47DRAFT_689207 [Mycena vitilis]